MSAERIVGVDFGTSTSVIRVKRYQDGEPIGDRLGTDKVTFNMSSTMVPTLIQKIPSGDAYFGYEAEIARRNAKTFQNFKVDIENPDEDIRRQARELTAEFFQYLAKSYLAQSEGDHLGECGDKERTIISYPVKWSNEAKDFLVQTAKDAGFPNVEGVDEAQAAIQAVTVQNADLLTSKGYFREGVPVNILLVDMGARTTELVLCRHTPGMQPKTDILSTWPRGGNTLFGGWEVDKLLQSYISQAIPEDGADLVLNRIGIEAYKAWKENAVSPALEKRESVNYFLALEVLLDLMDIEAEYSVSRDSFEDFAADYLRQFPELVHGCVSASGLRGDGIDLVILTGGHSQWYFVREMLSGKLNRFGETGLGKVQADPERIIPITFPQETVALGLVYGPLTETQITYDPHGRIRSVAERIIGVDFGTSTSVIRVKRYQDRKPIGDRLGTEKVIFNGSPIVPTLIQKLPTGDTYFGYEAEVDHHRGEQTFPNFKVNIENPDEDIRQQARKLTAEYFTYLADEYRKQSEGGYLGEIDDQQRTIISYPVKWSDETKAFMIKTAKDAGFPNVEGVDEAQAAIQAVMVQNADLLTRKGYFQDGVPLSILLIDMGAGTTDLVLCRHTPGTQPKTDILSTWPKGGNALFGGREVDELLRSYICRTMPEADAERVRKIAIKEYKAWKESMVSPALKKKETVDYFFFLNLLDINTEFSISRDNFETYAAGYLRQFPKLVNDCLEDAGVSGDNVNLVILTGGHSQWYFVREMLNGRLERFGEIALGKIQADPERIIPVALPQEAVALGLVYEPLWEKIPKVIHEKLI